jgi:D-alanyl-D-alanine carboxypeptidase
VLGVLPAQQAASKGADQPQPPTSSVAVRSPTRSGWIIQVGAFVDENEAKDRLTSVMSKAAKLLGDADPFTEPVVRGDKTYYRARFAGLGKDQAEATCRYLKRNDVECIPVRN